MIGVYKWLYTNFEQVVVDESAEAHRTDSLFLGIIFYLYFGILGLLVLMQIVVFVCGIVLIYKLRKLLHPSQQEQDKLLQLSESTLMRSVSVRNAF